MKVNLRITAWLSGCSCLILLTLGGVLWLNLPRVIPAEPPIIVTDDMRSTSLTAINQNPVVDPQTTVVKTQEAVVNPPATIPIISPLPPVAYPTGSIGEACELNNFPPYHTDRELLRGLGISPYDDTGNFKQDKEEKCRIALENHMNLINPNLWGREHDTLGSHSVHALVAIDNPLTFERIFADPAGDFARVQEALARPECQLGQETETNWQLNETCHADAFLNYAMVTRFCHNSSGILMRPNQYYAEADNPTPEQDRHMWIQLFEDGWVADKCGSLDRNLKLRLPAHTELRQQIQGHQIGDKTQSVYTILIELAARLGDEAAWLAHPLHIDRRRAIPNWGYEEGYKYGPLAEWFSTDLTDPTNLFSKLAPSVDRVRQFVSLFGKNITVMGNLIKFDHEALAQHLCSPPYYTPPLEDTEAVPEPPSCRTVANELRQEFHSDQSMLKTIATFEEIAIRLDVYE